jgi:hypothetical protein
VLSVLESLHFVNVPTFQRYILPPSSGLDLNPENGGISEMLAVLPISTKCKHTSRMRINNENFYSVTQKCAIRFTKYF